MQFWKWFIASALIAAGTIYYAWWTREQFYWTVVFLTTNRISIVILANMGLALALFLGRILKTIFLGRLRDIEVELLNENIQFAVTETCLALTIFRGELSVQVLVLFSALLFCKAFHWLAQSRVEHVGQTDEFILTNHIRLFSLQMVLILSDVSFVNWCISQQLDQSASVLILFAFEFIILSMSAICTAIKYGLHVVDIKFVEGSWHGKSSISFFIDLASELLRFFFYLVFFGIIFTSYGMPIHILRDLWVSYSSLRRRLQAYNRYRQLTANMNERFPDATSEEIEECGHTCIICRDAMNNGKKLPCGHIFHFQCLRQWLQQQQSCPTCRADIPNRMPPQRPPRSRSTPGRRLRMQPVRPFEGGANVPHETQYRGEREGGNFLHENETGGMLREGEQRLQRGHNSLEARFDHSVGGREEDLLAGNRGGGGSMSGLGEVNSPLGSHSSGVDRGNLHLEGHFRDTVRGEERPVLAGAIQNETEYHYVETLVPLRVLSEKINVHEEDYLCSPIKWVFSRGTLLIAYGVQYENSKIGWYRVHDGWIKLGYPPNLEQLNLNVSDLARLSSNRNHPLDPIR